MRAALRETVFLGVVTNLAGSCAVVAHPAFAAGDLHTDFLDEHLAGLARPSPPPIAAAALVAALHGATGGGRDAARRPRPVGDPRRVAARRWRVMRRAGRAAARRPAPRGGRGRAGRSTAGRPPQVALRSTRAASRRRQAAAAPATSTAARALDAPPFWDGVAYRLLEAREAARRRQRHARGPRGADAGQGDRRQGGGRAARREGRGAAGRRGDEDGERAARPEGRRRARGPRRAWATWSRPARCWWRSRGPE